MVFPAADCFIGVGSNQKDPATQVCEALARIGKLDGVRIMEVSPFYRSEPVGFVSTEWFINCVLRVSTSLAPARLLGRLQNIENAMGRREKRRGRGEHNYRARLIDLDILLYNMLITDEDYLLLPHPHLHERRFVLEPFCDIAPEIEHPLLGKTMAEILTSLEDKHQVERIESGNH